MSLLLFKHAPFERLNMLLSELQQWCPFQTPHHHHYLEAKSEASHHFPTYHMEWPDGNCLINTRGTPVWKHLHLLYYLACLFWFVTRVSHLSYSCTVVSHLHLLLTPKGCERLKPRFKFNLLRRHKFNKRLKSHLLLVHMVKSNWGRENENRR